MKKFNILIILLLIANLGFNIIKIKSKTQNASPGFQTTGSVYEGSLEEEYVMVTFLSGLEYWKNAYRGMQDAAKNLNVSTHFTGANYNDVNQQVTVLEQVIAKKPKGIILTCLNEKALREPINKAMSMGIPVITFDSDSQYSDRYSFLSTSNYTAGRKVANTMAELVNKKGKICIITVRGQQNLEERVAGFKDTIKALYPKMEIISVQDAGADQVRTAQIVGSLIQANDDLVGVFATEAVGGVGAAVAIREANMTDKIKVVSFDTDKGTLDAIKNGEIAATVAQGTYNMGYWSMLFVFHMAHDLVNPINGDWRAGNVAPLPEFVDTGINIVTKENLEYFY